MSKKAKVRIAQLSCDWKDSLTAKELNATIKVVGPTATLYDYPQDVVDSKVMFVSSVKLGQWELDLLWETGDLGMQDEDVWEGDTVSDIVAQLREHLAE